MENAVALQCPHCNLRNHIKVNKSAVDTDVVKCTSCGKTITSVGKVHAHFAQQAAGIGASERADDHVPLGGLPFGSTT